MRGGPFEKVLGNGVLQAAAKRLERGRTLRIAGVWGSSGAMVAAALGELSGRCVLLLTAHIDEADDAADDIEVLAGATPQIFPPWEVDVGTDHLNEEITGERLGVCNLLAERQSRDAGDAGDGAMGQPRDIIVAPVMALLQPVPSPRALAAGRLDLAVGDERDINSLAAWLVDAGFERVDQVDQQGQFARRGGIVDVFPAGAAQALRVEFFGDRIESIRQFDLDSQRSTEGVARACVAGLRVAEEAGQAAGLWDYLPPDAVVCVADPEKVAELAGELHARTRDLGGRIAPLMRPPGEVLEELHKFATVEMRAFGLREGLPKEARVGEGHPDDSSRQVVTHHRAFAQETVTPLPDGKSSSIHLGIRSLERLSLGAQEALAELEQLSGDAEVWVYCENPAEQKRFVELLRGDRPALAGRVRTAVGHVHAGFHWPSERLVVVGHHEVFGRYAKRRRIRRVRAGRPIESLLDLDVGEYVVHVAHGIARFDGLKLLTRDGRSEEYLALKFAGGVVLHVPASRIHLVQKYVGSRQYRPKLSHLGGTGWARQKDRAAEAVRDLAAEMIRVQAMRQAMPGLSYARATEWQRRFTGEFLYAETGDQIDAMRQIDEDMSLPRPMDRLLCGDVGYGKTELAMRAAFKVAEAGRQVAVLVPTTVLAAQHLRTFRERFADYPFVIESLSRFSTPGEQTRVCGALAAGRADVVIGTHRLLSGDVRFKDLGLLIIDEEQRFGVAHKEHLKGLRATVDVLTMTATPIPRTLHMALLGLRDISSLATPPLDRRAIHTEVVHYDERLVRQAVLRELARDGQVFYVHNRVHNIESVAEHLRRLVGEARVDVAHGQMPEKQLERAMLRFVRQQTDVLVCTTIIESGLDIPTANTMIIRDADRFGLAALHQLRGRVGRYKHRAYCYLLLPERRSVSAVAGRRLKAIEEFSDLGAGFQIAMRDLEIRGAGNILGREQSGHIAAIGYELYCQLLDEAVRELRGEKPRPQAEVHVELGLDAFIRPAYVPSARQRMEIYRRLAACEGRRDLAALRADLADAFGPPPGEMETLLDLAELRLLAGQLGVASIIIMGPDVVFTVRDFAAARGVFDGAPGSVRLPDERTVHWRPPPAYLQMPTLMTVLLRRLRQAAVTV